MAAVSSPQQSGVAGFKNGQADLRSALPVVLVIGAGAKGVGDGGSTFIGFGQGLPTWSAVLVQFYLKMQVSCALEKIANCVSRTKDNTEIIFRFIMISLNY